MVDTPFLIRKLVYEEGPNLFLTDWPPESGREVKCRSLHNNFGGMSTE